MTAPRHVAPRLVLLARDSASSRIVYHRLRARFDNIDVIFEGGEPRSKILKRRLRRQGLLTTLGQVAFQATVQRALRRSARKRIAGIIQDHGLDDSPVDGPVTHVPSVNDAATIDLLRRLEPAVVIVNGTRIVSRRVLGSVQSPFINMHAGVTPLYRGVAGAYWALVDGRPELAGTTVHVVDAGIDTGAVIAQATFEIAPEDNYITYGYLHTAAGLPLLVEAVQRAIDGTLATEVNPRGLESRLRSHPTLWRYLWSRLTRGVK